MQLRQHRRHRVVVPFDRAEERDSAMEIDMPDTRAESPSAAALRAE